MWFKRLLLPLGILFLLVLTVTIYALETPVPSESLRAVTSISPQSVVPGQENATNAGPIFVEAFYFGGAGNEGAAGVSIENSAMYIAGTQGIQGLLLRYDLPATTPTWTQTLTANSRYNDIVATGGATYLAGDFFPPVCGASDGVGGTEHKTGFAYYDGNGNLINCRSQNFFTYRGYEFYHGITKDTTNNAVYVAGEGELSGFGPIRTVLAKYNVNGILQWKRYYGTGSSGGSNTNQVLWLNGYLYLAGCRKSNLYGSTVDII